MSVVKDIVTGFLAAVGLAWHTVKGVGWWVSRPWQRRALARDQQLVDALVRTGGFADQARRLQRSLDDRRRRLATGRRRR